MKRGKVLPSVSQLQALKKFEQFIEGTEYLIAQSISIDHQLDVTPGTLDHQESERLLIVL